MPITLNCPKCRKPFRVRDESVGLRVKCPTCAAVLQVPASLAPASIDASKLGDSTPGAPSRPAGRAIPTKTAKTSDRGGDSMFDDLPEPGPSSGPPSLEPAKATHTQAMGKRRSRDEIEDEDNDRGARAARTGPLPPIPSTRRPGAGKTKSAVKKRTKTEEDPGQVIEDADGWRKVCKALRWVQIGFFLALLPAVGHFAVAAYCLQAENALPEKTPMKGMLDLGLSLWTEIEYASTLVVGMLAFLLVLIGRLGCTSIPDSARTRGMASGTLFLTFVAFGAFATYAAKILSPVFSGPILPHDAAKISWTVFVFIGLLAEGWFLLYLAQAGIPLGNTRVLREIAMSVLLLVTVIAGVLIANDFFALSMKSPKFTKDRDVEINLIQSGVYLMVSVLFIFRFTAIAGMIRKSIARWMEENEVTLKATPE